MMQITFIRHGEYNKETGLLTDTGIEQMTCSAMVLQDISDKQRGILRAEPFHPDPNNPSIIVPQLTYSDYLKNSVNKNENCKEGFKQCGILDSFNNKLCLPIKKKCPINFYCS